MWRNNTQFMPITSLSNNIHIEGHFWWINKTKIKFISFCMHCIFYTIVEWNSLSQYMKSAQMLMQSVDYIPQLDSIIKPSTDLNDRRRETEIKFQLAKESYFICTWCILRTKWIFHFANYKKSFRAASYSVYHIIPPVIQRSL